MTWLEEFIESVEKSYRDSPLKRRLEEIGKWLDRTYDEVGKSNGVKENLFVLGKRLNVLGRYFFDKKNFIVLGPRESGKTALIELLKTGKPVDSYNPTVGTVVVDSIFEIDEGFLQALKDVGGDKPFREVNWLKLINSINPDGIIFMIDGSQSMEHIESSIQIAFENCLSHYSSGIRNLKAFYVFLNFYDKWKDDPQKKRTLESRIQLSINEKIGVYPNLENLKIRVYKTQLASHGQPWNEATSALTHFSKDI